MTLAAFFSGRLDTAGVPYAVQWSRRETAHGAGWEIGCLLGGRWQTVVTASDAEISKMAWNPTRDAAERIAQITYENKRGKARQAEPNNGQQTGKA